MLAAAIAVSSGAFAQQVENDDMYFNSSDRASLIAKRTSENAAYAKRMEKQSPVPAEEFEDLSGNYSARNLNPEYAARANAQTAQVDDGNYFVNNYQYRAETNLNNYNNALTSAYYNPVYNTGYYSPFIDSWSSPYYGSAFDTYGSPWANPYYTSGWSSSFSYYYGNSWNYGWGPSYGGYYSYGYGNSYSPWGLSIGIGNSWGYGGYGGFYCPASYGYTNYYYADYGREITYGKRATRSGAVVRPASLVATERPRSNYVAPIYGREDTGGRVSSSGRTQQQQEAYYSRSWRTQQQQQNSQYPSRSGAIRGWSDNTSQSSGFYNPSNSGRSDSSPSRSSSSMSSGTRSSAPASSGSNGRTRGRD